MAKGTAPKHWVWLAFAVATLAAVVLLSIFADGAHVEAVIAFAAGLLIPGSPLGGISRRRAAATVGGALLMVSASGCSAGPAVLTALELARKIGCDVLCPECETSGGETP